MVAKLSGSAAVSVASFAASSIAAACSLRAVSIASCAHAVSLPLQPLASSFSNFLRERGALVAAGVAQQPRQQAQLRLSADRHHALRRAFRRRCCDGIRCEHDEPVGRILRHDVFGGLLRPISGRQEAPRALQQLPCCFRWNFVLTCQERVRSVAEPGC